MPPVDHDCSLRDIVVAMSNKIAKLEHELGQLKKAHIGPKSERSKISGSSLGLRVTRSIKLLDLYGDDVFAAAVADLDARGLADVGALAIACEQRRKDRRRPVPVELVLPAHLDDTDVIPHDLGAYDE